VSLQLVVDNSNPNPLYGKVKPAKIDLNWLYKKYRGVCWICRKFVPRDQASRDHIKPKSLGGTYEKENMALAHKVCNSKRGNGFKEIHFKHYETLKDEKDIIILEEHDLILQVWEDKRNGGYNVLLAKKFRQI
jgi:hypothetical protein